MLARWVMNTFHRRWNSILIFSHSLQIWRRLGRFSRARQVAGRAVRAAKCHSIKARRESSSTLADTIDATRVCSKTNHAQSALIRNDISVRRRSVKHQPVSWVARNSSARKPHSLQFLASSRNRNSARFYELASLMIIYAIINWKWPKILNALRRPFYASLT